MGWLLASALTRDAFYRKSDAKITMVTTATNLRLAKKAVELESSNFVTALRDAQLQVRTHYQTLINGLSSMLTEEELGFDPNSTTLTDEQKTQLANARAEVNNLRAQYNSQMSAELMQVESDNEAAKKARLTPLSEAETEAQRLADEAKSDYDLACKEYDEYKQWRDKEAKDRVPNFGGGNA
ncbi:hypothetical protein IJ579_03430 [bacterium]|nr:hypothetical protein [bacterium]